MPRHADWTDHLYRSLTNEEDARVCKAISDDACREVPGNFLRQLGAQTFTGLGDRLANPKTTLAWLLQAMGAPGLFLALIVPLREAGSLLPQLFIAGYLRQLAVRKWVWVVGSALQAVAVAGYALVAWTLEGTIAGLAIVGLVALFSLARGLCSIASKDVLGKTIPKTRRGQLSGWKSSLSGVMAMGAGAMLLLTGGADGSLHLYTLWLLVAAALWLIASIIYSTIAEFPGETSGGGNAWTHARQRLRLLVDDRPFRDFVTVRALAIGSGLSAPFVVSLAHGELGGGGWWLGVFIIVDGFASMVSAPIWGRLADRSSRTVLRTAMGVTATLLAITIGLTFIELSAVVAQVVYPALFFALGIAHSGVRLGRKTYLVDMAEGDQRTDYVAVSNSVIGVLLLVAGTITGALSLLSLPLALAVFAICALTGMLLGHRLPEVSA
ncbi:MFS transporter [Actomonas aquatica]|uniref:MFS transporter n=1 Tax=Actomonas aquatica TaxID=2866162 RepID=A0ABZ1C647_9BACT|nr:MFS transporter [Opitutus sp. WL0086]WRQ86853.1 MFS transporter [Opitutus sp. WL0086]